MSAEPEDDIVGGLAALVLDLCLLPSWRQTVELVELYPVLLTPAVDQVFAELTESVDDAARYVLEIHRDLLLATRTVEFDRALLAFEISKTPDGLAEDVEYVMRLVAEVTEAHPDRRLRAIEERPLVLHPGVARVLEDLAGMQESEQEAEAVRDIGRLLERCRAVGVARALAEGSAREYLEAEGGDAMGSLIVSRPELLTPEGDAVLRELEERESGAARSAIAAHRVFLRQFAESHAAGKVLDLTTWENLVEPEVMAAVTDVIEAEGEDGMARALRALPGRSGVDLSFAECVRAARMAGEDLRAMRCSYRWLVARRSAEAGPETAAAEAANRNEAELVEITHAFLDAFNVKQLRGLVEAQPILLDPVAEEIVDTFPFKQDNRGVVLSRCRSGGVDEVFASVDPGGSKADSMAALTEAAWELAREYHRTQRLASLVTATVFAESALLLHSGRPAQERAAGLGLASELRLMLYQRTGDERHLDLGIDAGAEAVSDGTPFAQRDIAMVNLAGQLRLRYERHADIDDLRRAVDTMAQIVLADTGKPSFWDDVTWEDFCEGYALMAALLARRLRSVEDLDRVLADLPQDGPLGHLLTARYELTHAPKDLENLLEFRKLRVRLAPGDFICRVALAVDLANAYSDGGADYETAIEALRAALEVAADDEERVLAWVPLGHLYTLRAHEGTISIDDALSVLTQALEIARRGEPELHASCLLTLARAYQVAYRTKGDPADLRRCLDALASIARLPANTTMTARADLERAGTMYLLYERTGDRTVLSAAVELAESVDPKYDAELRAMKPHQLAVLYLEKYRQGGELTDLDRAIIHAERALDHAVRGGDTWFRAVMNLANRRTIRAQVTGNVGEADLAVALLEQVAALQAGPERRARYLTNLGNALLQRYQLDPREEDLVRVVEVTFESAELTDDTSPYLSRRLANHGNALRILGDERQDATYVDAAVEAFDRAIELAPNARFRATYTVNLAGALLWKGRSQGERPARERAVRLLEELLPSEAPYHEQVMAARFLGQARYERGEWEQAASACLRGLDALEIMLRGERLRGHKETWMAMAANLPTMAALALVHAGDLSQAVRVLERGRAVLLAHALERDTGHLTALSESGYPHLAQQWLEVSGRIARLEAAEEADDSGSRINLSSELSTAHQQLHELVGAVRRLPGFEGFPGQKPSGDGARVGCPLIYLVPAPDGGCALILKSADDVEMVRLPRCTENDVIHHVVLLHTSSDDDVEQAVRTVVDWVRTAVIEPVRESTPHTKQAVIVPVGLLGLLPLHAGATLAGIDVAYTPSAQAYEVASRRARGRRIGQALAAGDPDGTDLAPLPHARMEAQLVEAVFETSTALVGEGATRDGVLRLAADADVLHFACHGVAALDSPLDSGLMLAGGEVLTVRDLIARHWSTRLAVLSACETGLPGARLPDEVIGLPTSLLQAGTAGVIATMWKLPDDCALIFSVAFYDALRRGLAPRESAMAAVGWLRTTTDGEKVEYFSGLMEDQRSWLPSAVAERCWEGLVLNDPSSRTYAEPHLWAAFAYYGA